ncbi:hypothetical protein QJQ45_011147 [Haematococcus lacustris]|nr:hypothetical protein QJQ45_011147 [Haematococcus lacustris]
MPSPSSAVLPAPHTTLPASTSLPSPLTSARATTRKHHLHQLLFSQNASNPFELVVEAATGKRQLHPRQWQPVDLLLPSGCDHAAVAAMAAELAAHVAAHCHGAQADLPASPPRRDALRNPQASLITTTTASTTLHLGTAPFAAAAHPPAAPPWSPQAAGGSWPGGPRQEAAWAAPSHPPPLQPTITLALSQPTTPAGHLPLPPAPAPPLHPPPPHSAPAASPAVPPPSTQGGAAALPTPHTALTASLPAHLHSSVLLGGGDGAHGHPTAGGMQPAGYGPITSQAAAMAAGGGWVTASSVQPLRAAPGGLFSERHSLRRHVQLTATWLEGRVAGLLTKHAPSMAAAQMRHLLDSSRVGGGGGGSSRGEQQGGGGPGPGGGVMLTPQPGGAEQSRGVQASLGPGGEQQPGPQPQQQPLGSVWGGRGRGGQGEAWASQGASSLPPPPPQPASPLTAADRHGSPPGRDPGPAPDPLGEAAGSMRGGSGAGVGQGEGGKGQGARQGSGPQAQAEALQAVLAALAGGVEPPAAGLGGESRGSLAARFTAFINSSLMGHQGPGPGAAWTGSQAMWRDMLQVVSAATANTLQQVAGTCWDEGAFLAGLWNLHTGLLNAGLVAAKAAAAEAQQEAAELRTQVRRLEPLLEWEHQARQELDGLRTGYTSTKALLQLAVSERDALLRENDKIILYYKKELRRFRREQRRNAWRLAKKLQSVQQQLSLVQRDRERLVEAVSYTKGQAVSMVSMVQGVNDRFSRMSRASSLVAAASDVFGGPDIGAIESSLQSLVMTVNKVQEITQEAEEHHFLMEEKVTAAAAADAVADDLVDAVLAGGDPDAVLSATAAAAAAAQEALEVDGLVPGNDDDDNYIAEAEPGPEDPAAGVEPEVSPEEAVDEGAQEVEAADDVKAEEEGAAVEGEPSEGPPAAPLAPAPSTELSHSPSSRQSQAGSGASSPTLPPAEPGAGKPSKGGKGKHKKKGGTDPHQGAAGMEGAQAGAVGPWGSSGMDGAAGGRVGKVGVDKEVQTGTELLEGVVGGREGSSLEAAVLQSMDEAAKEAADSLGLDLTQGAAGRTRAKPARTARTPPGGSRKKGSLMSKLSNTPSPLPTDPPPTPPPLPPAPEPRPSSALALQLDNPGDGRLGEGAVLAGGLTPRSSSAMKALVAGVQEKLAALQATLSDREERLGVCQTRVEELEQQLQSKLQEQQATKKKLEATHSIYQALRKKLQALGVDPDAHQLVLPDSRPATAQLETISQVCPSHHSALYAQQRLPCQMKNTILARWRVEELSLGSPACPAPLCLTLPRLCTFSPCQVGNTPETNSTWAETTDTTRDGPQSEMSFSRGPKSSRPAATANIKAKPAMKSSKSRRRSSSPRRKAKHAPVPAAKPVLTPPPVATTPESPSPPAASNTGANLRRRSHSPPQRRALSPLASSRALEDEAALGSSTDLNLRPLRSPVSTAFVLGKERVVERKVELSGAERLAENLVSLAHQASDALTISVSAPECPAAPKGS